MPDEDNRHGLRNDFVESIGLGFLVVGVFIIGLYFAVNSYWIIVIGGAMAILGTLMSFNYKVNYFFTKLFKKIIDGVHRRL